MTMAKARQTRSAGQAFSDDEEAIIERHAFDRDAALAALRENRGGWGQDLDKAAVTECVERSAQCRHR